MPKKKYEIGDRFGNWTLLARLPRAANDNCVWQCACDCGAVKKVYATNIYSGKSKACRSCAAKERERKKRNI